MKNQSTFAARLAVVAVSAATLSLTANLRAAEQPKSPLKSGTTTSGDNATMNNTKAGAEMKAKAGGELSKMDKEFMMTAAKGGMMEVHMGQMGVQQGQSAEVKKIGNIMITDHTKANNQLMSLAATKGVKLDTRHKMAKIAPDNFDQAWLAQMLTDHQKTIAAFESEAKGGTDADVKGWAVKTLPTLKKHLKMVQDAQGKMKKAS